MPRLDADKRGNLHYSVLLFLSGVQAAVWYGFILLFATGLTKNVSHCTTARRGAERCGNYYLKSKTLRIACSEKCKSTLRHQQIYRAVKRLRTG